MKYYIVFNEWNYPTESGREFIGDFDSSMDAEYAAISECRSEEDGFSEATSLKPSLSVMTDGDYNCIGYHLLSSDDKSANCFFRSVIIKREV